VAANTPDGCNSTPGRICDLAILVASSVLTFSLLDGRHDVQVEREVAGQEDHATLLLFRKRCRVEGGGHATRHTEQGRVLVRRFLRHRVLD